MQGILADLHSNLDERGLITTVSGEFLFAMDSDEVQAGAYDTLAKVAELIGTYDDHKVLIIGHSDAVGDAAYNRQLSERRAELVKQFFIDNFQLPPDRLAAEGVGEARPIASNATPQGRRASRRVEILILNLSWPAPPGVGCISANGECQAVLWRTGHLGRGCPSRA